MSVEVSIDDQVLEEGSQISNKQLTVDSVINWQLPVLAIMFVTIVFVAIKTVVHRHESRTAYMKFKHSKKKEISWLRNGVA